MGLRKVTTLRVVKLVRGSVVVHSVCLFPSVCHPKAIAGESWDVPAERNGQTASDESPSNTRLLVKQCISFCQGVVITARPSLDQLQC